MHDIEYQIVMQIADQFIDLINQHVKDVIGEVEGGWIDEEAIIRNELRAKQRKRAGVQHDVYDGE